VTRLLESLRAPADTHQGPSVPSIQSLVLSSAFMSK
jgi:hypothetical protein